MRPLVHVVITAALLLGAASCGGDDDDEATPATVAAVTTTGPRPSTTSSAAASTSSSTSTTSSSIATTTTSTTTTTTTTPVPATPAPIVLPTPVAAPTEDGSSEDTFEVATLEIPKIGLRATVWEGIRLSTLDHGPGHWPGTALPGAQGNVVVAGHRTSHNAEFRHLDDLAPGDDVIMSTLAGRFVYRVVRIEIVTPDALWIVDQTPAHTATLFACHPPGSIRERIVAHLELVV